MVAWHGFARLRYPHESQIFCSVPYVLSARLNDTLFPASLLICIFLHHTFCALIFTALAARQDAI